MGVAGRPPKKKLSQEQLDQQARNWVAASIKKYFGNTACRNQGNRPKELQAVMDNVSAVLMADGPPDNGRMASVIRVTGISAKQFERGKKLADDNLSCPSTLCTPGSSACKFTRSSQAYGPKKKKGMMWVYDWFHNHCDLVTVDKSRPAKLKGRKKLLIGGEEVAVTCVPHVRTGYKKDLVKEFFGSKQYRQWKIDNNGETMSPKVVEGCICTCMRSSSVNECACKVCTEMSAALKAWHTQRKKWHAETKCTCDGCTVPGKSWLFQHASKNMSTFRASVCCKKTKYPHLQLPHQPDVVPEFYNLKCCKKSPDIPCHVKQCTECGVEKRLYR